MPHEYPPPNFPFEDLVTAWKRASDAMTREMVHTALKERDVEVELRQQNLQEIKSAGWSPDGRFFAGVAMAGVGGYLLWKFGKKRR